jgi:hypothetical protein
MLKYSDILEKSLSFFRYITRYYKAVTETFQ